MTMRSFRATSSSSSSDHGSGVCVDDYLTRPVLILVAFWFALVAPSLARADLMPFNGAEVAPNVAEIRIEPDGVRVKLEIFIDDIALFRDIVPDHMFDENTRPQEGEASRLVRFASEVLSVRRDDGTTLPLRAELIEPRKRIDRSSPLAGQVDPITGRVFPAPPVDPRVLYAELLYDFEGNAPDAMTITPPLTSDGTPRATIGMIVFDRDVPVSGFRYLSAPARLNIDWGDPWYSVFDNKRLRRQHAAGTMSHIYVDAREVRHEVLIRARDLDPWLGLELVSGDRIGAKALDTIKRDAADLFASRNPVSIDGVNQPPEDLRAAVLTLDGAGLTPVPEGDDISADTAFVGVILSWPHRNLPQRASVAWDMFDDRLKEIPVTLTDRAGPFLSSATPDSPEAVWNNHLKNYEDPTVTPVLVTNSRLLDVPLAAVLIAVAAVALGIAAIILRGRARIIAAICALCGVVGAPVLANTLVVQVASPFAPSISEPEANQVMADLLDRVAIAHLEVTPDARKRELAPAIASESLDTVAAELERALVLEAPGVGVARLSGISGVELEELTNDTDGAGFSGLLTAVTDLASSHWGHAHQRRLKVRGVFEVAEVEGVWKLTGLTIVETRSVDG